MFKNEFQKVVGASQKKLGLLESNAAGYFMAAALAGFYVGLGIILIFTISGLLQGAPYTKIIMGVSFGIALSLVLMAGSELFTGNVFIMGAGSLEKKVSWADTGKLWAVCYVGNWVGSIVVALLYSFTGLGSGAVAEAFANGSMAKMSLDPSAMFFRGILCNILVCLAVWCFFKLETEIGKLLMIFWCLFAFITSGFEHSIANMTLLTIGMLEPAGVALTWGGYFTNILVVTLGNMVGAFLFLVVPYFMISRDK